MSPLCSDSYKTTEVWDRGGLRFGIKGCQKDEGGKFGIVCGRFGIGRLGSGVGLLGGGGLKHGSSRIYYPPAFGTSGGSVIPWSRGGGSLFFSYRVGGDTV